MFASFRRAVDASLEYTSAHLRHQLIITICNHKEFFYSLLMESIKGTYGFPRMDPDEYQRLHDEGLLTDAQVDDHNTPGPYSFLGYLRALQKPDFWGDELCLCLLSICFQIGITVINTENFTRTQFRHKRDIKDSNMVLCHGKGCHYVPAHKYNFCCIWTGHPALRLVCVHSDGCQMHSDRFPLIVVIAFRWMYLHPDGYNYTQMGAHCVQMDAISFMFIFLFSSESH